MVQPASIVNTQNQSLPVHVGADGASRLPLVVGEVNVGLTPTAGWVGAATHVDGATFTASDGVSVSAGVTSGGLAKRFLVDADGRQVSTVVAAQGALVDRSGAITVGATSQTLASALTTRKYLFVHNIDDNEDLWINFTNAAVLDKPSIRLKPDQSFIMETGFVSTELVTVIATTIGHKFTAKEG